MHGIPVALATVALAVAAASAQVAVPSRYARDGEIGLSVRNEVDAATARARRWLVATQLESGAWQSTNRCGATAVAALALFDPFAEGMPGDSPAGRAAKWLRAIPEKELDAALPEERAWRDLALAILDASAGGDTGAAASDPFATFFDACAAASPGGIAGRCAAAMVPSVAAGERSALAGEIAAEWRKGGVPREDGRSLSRTCFFMACFIGNCADGILSADSGERSERVPWREDAASLLISAQRVDPGHPGTAFWRGSETARLSDWCAGPVPETALAILCLDLL